MSRTVKVVLFTSILSCLLISCSKDRYIFTMKYIQLDEYEKSKYPEQNLFLKVVKEDNRTEVLAHTETYPSSLALPATFAVIHPLEVHLYKEHIVIELWGDSTGFITSATIDMKDYKIIFPIEMETENETVRMKVMGSWE